VAVVHGARDPETKKVDQKILFTFYSKAEALAALGEQQHFFRQIVEDEHPEIRLNWRKIDKGIEEHMNVLPDLYAYKQERVEGRFRSALVGFTKELLLNDPQSMVSSARLLQANRAELEYVQKLIDWRLRLCEQEESRWNQDNPFYWRTVSRRSEVCVEAWEALSELYLESKYDEAEALARLLIECWPNFAEGWNYLGLIAMDCDDLETAVDHFEKAAKVGRTLFPKRIRKDMWWTDHATRPYIRALVYESQAQTRLGEHSKALSLCDRLEKECHQDITAADERVSVYLNAGLWEQAEQAARYVHKIYPAQNIPLALALFELGDKQNAIVHFLNGALRFPTAAQMVCGMRTSEPKHAHEARDHNQGVGLLRDLVGYLDKRSRASKTFFRALLNHPTVNALIEESVQVRLNWSQDRSGNRKWFERMTELESFGFARDASVGLDIE